MKIFIFAILALIVLLILLEIIDNIRIEMQNKRNYTPVEPTMDETPLKQSRFELKK